MKIPILSYVKNLIEQISLPTKADRLNPEKLSDLLNRLRRYDSPTNSYKLDVLSIPHVLRMVLKLFPHKYCNHPVLKEKTLRAFVTTIIPGADKEEKFLIKMYEDSYYPFHTYCGYFIYDLNKRSKNLFNCKDYFTLSLEKRTLVIQNALSGRELTVRLYKGAILMAQVSYYGAIYKEEEGCDLIDFPGRNQGYKTEEITHPFAADIFCKELSTDGQPW